MQSILHGLLGIRLRHLEVSDLLLEPYILQVIESPGILLVIAIAQELDLIQEVEIGLEGPFILGLVELSLL